MKRTRTTTEKSKAAARANALKGNIAARMAGPYPIVMALSARPQGATKEEIREASGGTDSGVSQLLCRLVKSGELQREHNRRWGARYFTTAEARDAYKRPVEDTGHNAHGAGRPVGAKDSKPRKVDTSRGAEVMQPAKGKAGCVLRVTAPHWRSKPIAEPVEVITPAHVVPQILPSAPVYSRSQIAPGEQFAGLGLRFMKPGEYLEPASGWVKAAGA